MGGCLVPRRPGANRAKLGCLVTRIRESTMTLGSNTPPPAFVLGGYEAGLAVVGSLGRAGVPVVALGSSPRETTRHSRYATACVPAPDPADATTDYIGALLRLAADHGPGLLVPTTDETLEAV